MGAKEVETGQAEFAAPVVFCCCCCFFCSGDG